VESREVHINEPCRIHYSIKISIPLTILFSLSLKMEMKFVFFSAVSFSLQLNSERREENLLMDSKLIIKMRRESAFGELHDANELITESKKKRKETKFNLKKISETLKKDGKKFSRLLCDENKEFNLMENISDFSFIHLEVK
jgi:hypothetical protein